MKKSYLALTLLSSVLLLGCANNSSSSSIASSGSAPNSSGSASGSSSETKSSQSDSSKADSSSSGEAFSNETFAFEEESFPNIEEDFSSQEEETLPEGTSVDLSTLGEGEVFSITEGGTYIVYGSASNASISVKTTGDVVLYLNGMSLTSLSDSPLYVQKAGSFTIHVASKTKNYIADSSSNTLEAAILVKKVPLSVEGEGYLYVQGNGLSNDEVDSGVAIQDAKGVHIEDTHVLVTQSTSHAIKAKLGFSSKNAKLSLISSKDAIHTGSEEDDSGVVTEVGNVDIEGGVFASSTKGDGIDSEGEIVLKDVDTHIETEGTFVLYSSADDTDGTLYEDSRYVKNGDSYKKIGSDEMNRYQTRYYLEQKCKGIKSAGGITVSGGHHYLNTTDDCIASDTSISLNSGEYVLYTLDQALNSDQALNVGEQGVSAQNEDFTVKIFHSYEGIQGGCINFYDAYTYIVSEDDGINATSDTDGYTVSMNFHANSTVWISAEGDGVDSNGNITMDGGELYVFGPTNGGNGALDFDGSFVYTGGTILALGQQGMVQTPDASSINVLSYNLSSYSADTALSILGGELEWSVILPKSYSQMNLILASPQISVGVTYSLYSNLSNNASYRNGVYVGEAASSPSSESSVSITAKQGLNTYGSSSGGQGGQGGPGGGGHGGPGGR